MIERLDRRDWIDRCEEPKWQRTFAQVWTFRGDEPMRSVLYADLEEGRAAAGAGVDDGA